MLEALRAALDGAGSGGIDSAATDRALRAAHTLKGAARVVKMNEVSELSHSLEDTLRALGASPSAPALLEAARQTLREIAYAASDLASPAGAGGRTAPSSAPASAATKPPGDGEFFRVERARLKTIEDTFSELLVALPQIGALAEEAGSLAAEFETLAREEESLRHGLGALLYRAPENREFARAASYVNFVSRQIRGLQRLAARLAARARRVETLDDNLHALQVTPAGDVLDGLADMAAEIGSELAKPIQFDSAGFDIAMDRPTLQRLRVALVHLIRNSIDHGIESAAERVSSGKPPRGRIRVELAFHGGRYAVEVADDGRGLPTREIRRIAAQAGLINESDAARMPDDQIHRLIFHPHLSTPHQVTRLSGRPHWASPDGPVPVYGLAELLGLADGIPPEGRFHAVVLTIINDILDLSKIEAGKLEIERIPYNLNTVLEQTVDVFVTPVAAKPIELDYDIAPDVPLALVSDPTRLRQILLNLTGNAIKFTASGFVSVRVRNAPACPGSPPRIAIAVADSGTGITPEMQAKLFDPFVQESSGAARKFGGSGLGLAISRRLTEMMGGTIGVESTPGQGSTFNVIIPATPAPGPGPALQPFAGEQAWHLSADSRSTPSYLSKLARFGFATRAFTDLAGLLAAAGAEPPPAVLSLELPVEEALLAQISAAFTDPASPRRILVWTKADAALAATAIVAKTLRDAGSVLIKPAKFSAIFSRLVSPPKSVADSTQPSFHPYARLRVLVAEDKLVNQSVARRMLDKLNITPDIAPNGLDAVRRCSETPYDLILTDLQMPEMDWLNREAVRWFPPWF